MENAAPLVKEKRDHITLTNDEHGVSVILEKILSKESLEVKNPSAKLHYKGN
jgi:hypothetical protein